MGQKDEYLHMDVGSCMGICGAFINPVANRKNTLPCPECVRVSGSAPMCHPPGHPRAGHVIRLDELASDGDQGGMTVAKRCKVCDEPTVTGHFCENHREQAREIGLGDILDMVDAIEAAQRPQAATMSITATGVAEVKLITGEEKAMAYEPGLYSCLFLREGRKAKSFARLLKKHGFEGRRVIITVEAEY